jgi:sugar transferase (PEP-CTERM system associated)
LVSALFCALRQINGALLELRLFQEFSKDGTLLGHIRVLRHYIHAPYLFMAGADALILFAVAFLGYATRYGYFPLDMVFASKALVLSLTLVLCMVGMGVYESRLREGYIGMMLRSAVAIFLLGVLVIAILAFLMPIFELGRGVLFFATVEGFILLGLFRLVTNKFIDEDSLKKRVLVLGTGERAMKIASRMRRRSDQRAFVLCGFLTTGSDEQQPVAEVGAKVINPNCSIAQYCRDHAIDEVVVAVDERRRSRDAGQNIGLPLDDLLDCRLSGIDVCEVQAFIEREASKVDIDLLQPSWMVFSDGFVSNFWRDGSKRLFDIAAALGLLLIVWPIMLVTSLLIGISSLFKEPILYRQERVGLNNQPFDVLKFRSMSVNAESSSGAVWATKNDPRVTRIGRIIRKSRIDELPQLFNVLVGQMSFVGPRPERPAFVETLAEGLPYYTERHRLKPGITGWAQLCYPYGASVEDAKEKLQYDLYYLKNHSVFLDIVILIQTIEVVLVGEGAR